MTNTTKRGHAAATAAKSLQSCPTLCDPIDGSLPGSPVPGILQARTLDGLPFPSPMHESEKWKGSHSVVSDSSRPHGLQPTRLLHPRDFPGESTGMECHCLLQRRHDERLNLTKSILLLPTLFLSSTPPSFIFLLILQYGASFCFWLFNHNLLIHLLIKSHTSSATYSWILWMAFRSS